MDRRELEIMLNEAFDRGIVSVGHLVHETVEVGFLNELGRTGPLPADRRRLAPGERQLPRGERDRRGLGAGLYRRDLAGISESGYRRHGGDGRGLRLGEAGEDPGLHRRRRPEGRRVLGSREAVARQGRRRCPRGLEGLRAPTLIPWGVRMRPQALWHTHANAQPRIRTYPCIRIRIYA